MVQYKFKHHASSYSGYAYSRGSVMIAVLWSVMIGALMLSLLYRQQRLLVAVSSASLEKVQARWAARGGVEMVVALLENDLTSEDSSFDDWYDDEMTLSENQLSDSVRFSIYCLDEAWGGVRYGLMDEASKINLNEANELVLTNLGMSETHVAALKDWVDRDNEARGMGAEQTFYNSRDIPHDIRQGPMTTVRELALVRSDEMGWKELLPYLSVHSYEVNERNESVDDLFAEFDDALLEEEDSEEQPSEGDFEDEDLLGGSGDSKRFNLKKMDEKAMAKEFGFTKSLAKAVKEKANDLESIFDLVQDGVSSSGSDEDDKESVSVIDMNWVAENIDDIALGDEERFYGKVNVNTASFEVLLAMIESEADVDAIMGYRDSALGPVTRIGDLYLDGVIGDDAFEAVAEKLTVKSNVFRFTARGETASGVAYEIEVVLDRGQDGIPILYWHENE